MKLKIGGSLQVSLTSYKRELKSEIHDFKRAGYDFAELALGLSIKTGKTFEDRLKTLRNLIPILSAHLPSIDHKKEEIEKCKNFIEILSDQGIHLFVMHLFSPNLQTKDNFDLKIKTIKYLADFANSKDSNIVLENTEEDVITLKRVFDVIPKIYFCLDIGHANIFVKENRSIKLINTFGKLLKHIHIHDNVGGDSEDSDIHLPIGEGNINFKPIFEKLKEINYSGNITLELYKPDLESIKKSIRRIRELF